ncbi:MAG: LamG-like jellyroll fold domain-containing protein, partial [Bacteroidota bacterium]
TDGGVAWESMHDFGAEVWSFDISRADPDVFYVVSAGGVYTSTDRGATFSQITTPPGVPSNQVWQMMVGVSGTDADELWLMDKHAAGSSGSRNRPRVWYSSNGGSLWTSWHTSTLEGRQYTAFAHHVGSNGGVYVASLRGSTPGTNPAKVFYRDKSMTDWAECSTGLPASANVQKILPYYRGNVLRWAGNRGVWEMPLVEQNWAPIAQPFVNGKEVLCAGDPVEFDSYSVNKANATYSWSIPGAATTTSLTEREVRAIYAAPGTYTATLTILQDGKSDSKSLTIEVGDNCSPDPLPGNSVSLSGASEDFVAMDAPLGITTNTLTISGWIKPEANQVNTACIFFARGSSAFGLNYQGTTGNLSIHWNNSQWWWNSGLAPTPGEWNHVAMAVEPTRVVLYLNGVPAVRNFGASPYNFDSPIAIGRDLTRGDRNFAGEVDEVVLYDRTLSQDEIRELMHLTRTPASETGVLAYYQFNRDAGTVTNRAGGTHAKLAGGAVRTTSSAPVGPGASHRQTVTTAGNVAFTGTGLSLEFSPGTTPNGELCVTRIDLVPHQAPAAPQPLDKYWIVHNYGSNTSFTELASLTFDGVGEVAPGIESSPQSAELFKRASTAHGDTWGGSVATATAATAGADGSLTFGAGNGQTS